VITTSTSNSMGGFFLGFGMDMLLKKNYGVGFSWDLTPARANYSAPVASQGVTETVQYRQHFIDFNGIYAPINNKKVVLKIMGGIGDAKTGISINESECLSGSICAHGVEPFTSANHFDLHVGVGVQVFVTDHWFIRPQFDFHYVPNLTQEFSSDAVVGGMVWVGYSWGDR
jgi:opacity protein-like surface antigen